MMEEQESMVHILNHTQEVAYEEGYKKGMEEGIVKTKQEILHFLLQKMDLVKACEYMHIKKEEALELLE